MLAALFLGLMAFVALPAYMGASSTAVDLMSLAWLLAIGTAVPIGLASAARRFAQGPVPGAVRASVEERPAQHHAAPEVGVQSTLDPLTGLLAYEGFADELQRQMEQAVANDYPISLAMVDIDELAAINDASGQEAGDRVIACIGKLISTQTRSDDLAFRIGGDEFAIVMPHCSAGRAQSVVRRLLLAALEAGDGAQDGAEWSFSAGISSYPELSNGPAGLRRDAEAALKWAKRNGRTDVQLFDAFRDLTEEQRRDDRAGAEIAFAGDDDFTSGEHDAPPIQLRFLGSQAPPVPRAEWVDPRLVMIGLAEDPEAAGGGKARRRSRGSAARSRASDGELVGAGEAD